MRSTGGPTHQRPTSGWPASCPQKARTETGFLRWLPWVLCLTGARLNEICQAVREDIKVSVSIPGTTWLIHADPHGVEIAVLNLVVNANNAMPNGGRITISARNVSIAEIPHGKAEAVDGRE